MARPPSKPSSHNPSPSTSRIFPTTTAYCAISISVSTRGRPLCLLATGADQRRLAHRVAAHLGIFTGVLASDGAHQLLTSRSKLDFLCALSFLLKPTTTRWQRISRSAFARACHRTDARQPQPRSAASSQGARHIPPTRVFLEHKPFFASLISSSCSSALSMGEKHPRLRAGLLVPQPVDDQAAHRRSSPSRASPSLRRAHTS